MSKKHDISVDQINEALSTIQSMKNKYRAFERSEAAVLVLSTLVGGIKELETALVKRKKEVEEAEQAANAAKVAALKAKEYFDEKVKDIHEKWAKEVEYQKDKAAKEIGEITDRVARFREESDATFKDLNEKKASLQAEIVKLEKDAEHARGVLDRLKQKLG